MNPNPWATKAYFPRGAKTKMNFIKPINYHAHCNVFWESLGKGKPVLCSTCPNHAKALIFKLTLNKWAILSFSINFEGNSLL